jgi:hypothetical protein
MYRTTMFKVIISTALLLGCFDGNSAKAGPSISLTGTKGGSLSGAPGDFAGFGFEVTPDPAEFISFTGSVTINEDNPSLVTYTDFIGLQGGPSNFVLTPASGHWAEDFNGANQTGVGSFQINAAATPGSQDKGTIRILYAIYNSDPNTCSVNCGGTPGYVDVKFDVDVVPDQMTSAPEPATGALVSWGLGLALCFVSSLFRKRTALRATRR